MADLDHLKIVIDADSKGVESKLLGISNALKTLRSNLTSGFAKNIDLNTAALKRMFVTINTRVSDGMLARFERFVSAMERLKGVGRIHTKFTDDVSKATAQASNITAYSEPTNWGASSQSGGAITRSQGGYSGYWEDWDEVLGKAKKTKSIGEIISKQLTIIKGKLSPLLRAFGRIALYRMLRSIIKLFTDSLSTGLKNVYEYSKQVGTNFHNIRDDIKSSGLYLTNALGAAASSLIENIAPTVIRIMDAVAEGLNHVSEMFAYLRGDEEYTKAIKGNFAESNEEAKKLRNTLLGFDEINRLNGDNGNGDAEDYSRYFVQEKVNIGRAQTALLTAVIATIGAGLLNALTTVVRIAEVVNGTDSKGLLGGLTKISGLLGNGTAGGGGTITSSLGGILTLVGKISAGLGSVLSMRIFDVQFQNYLNAEEMDEKIVSQIGACFAAVGSVALAGVAGGAAGIMIAIPTILSLAIKDLLLNDETRGKINEKIKGFADFVSSAGTSEHAAAAENFTNLAEDIDKYAEDVGKSTSFLERVDAWFKLQQNALYDVSTGGINWVDGGISQISSPAEDTFNFGKSVFNLVVDGESIAGAVIKSITGSKRRN